MKNIILFLFLLIFIIICGCVYSPPRKTMEVYNSEIEREWKIAHGYYFLYPTMETLGLWNSSSLYSEVLYRNIGGQWVEWVILRKKVKGTDCHFPDIYWTDKEYVYISSCTGIYCEKKGGNSCNNLIVTIYKVHINNKLISQRESFAYIYYNNENIHYLFYVPMLRYNQDIILIIPDRDFEHGGLKLIKIKKDLLEDIKCYLIEKSRVKINTDIIVEQRDNLIKLKWIDENNKRHEKIVNVDGLKEEKCSVE